MAEIGSIIDGKYEILREISSGLSKKSVKKEAEKTMKSLLIVY